MGFLLGHEAIPDFLHELSELNLKQPFDHSTRLLDPLLGLLHGQILLMLENVPLNQVPVLKLLLVDQLLVPALFDEHAARLSLLVFLARVGLSARLFCSL